MIDLKALNYNELITLEKQIRIVLQDRTSELVEAKKKWLKCEKSDGKFFSRIEALKKKFEKISGCCNKALDALKSHVVGVHVNLHEQIECFIKEWNTFLDEFNAEVGKFNLMPSDIVKVHTKKGKK
jgi:hypothetical protein